MFNSFLITEQNQTNVEMFKRHSILNEFPMENIFLFLFSFTSQAGTVPIFTIIILHN